MKHALLAALFLAAAFGQCAQDSAIGVSYKVIDPGDSSPGILVTLSTEDQGIEVFIVTVTFLDVTQTVHQVTKVVQRPSSPRGFHVPQTTAFVIPVSDKITYVLARGLRQGAAGYVVPGN